MSKITAALRIQLMWVAAIGAALLSVQHAVAAEDYERFFGRYEGQLIVEGDGDLSKRDLRVEIGPAKNGFEVEWVALIRKPDGRTKRVAYKIAFRSARRGNIYGSAMKSDAFGHSVPLDPLKGEPYVWANIDGNVLTVKDRPRPGLVRSD